MNSSTSWYILHDELALKLWILFIWLEPFDWLEDESFDEFACLSRSYGKALVSKRKLSKFPPTCEMLFKFCWNELVVPPNGRFKILLRFGFINELVWFTVIKEPSASAAVILWSNWRKLFIWISSSHISSKNENF